MTNKSTFFFIHIPKTAGSSISDIIKSQFQQKDICPYFHEAHLAKNQNLEWKLYWGHLPKKIKEKLKDPFVFTFLRDPIERFISEYNYVKDNTNEIINQNCKTWAHHLIEPYTQFSIKNLIDQPDLIANRLNLQTLWLNGLMGDQKISTINWPSALQNAMQELRMMDFIGFTDEFESSLNKLRNVSGLNIIYSKIKIKFNRNKKSEKWVDEINSKIVEILKGYARHDYCLLNFAKSLNKTNHS